MQKLMAQTRAAPLVLIVPPYLLPVSHFVSILSRVSALSQLTSTPFLQDHESIISKLFRDVQEGGYLVFGFIARADEMKEKIVLNVKVEENYEYTKNSLDVDIEVLILDYTKSTNTNIKKGALKSLVEANKELQNNLKSTIKVKQVKT